MLPPPPFAFLYYLFLTLALSYHDQTLNSSLFFFLHLTVILSHTCAFHLAASTGLPFISFLSQSFPSSMAAPNSLHSLASFPLHLMLLPCITLHLLVPYLFLSFPTLFPLLIPPPFIWSLSPFLACSGIIWKPFFSSRKCSWCQWVNQVSKCWLRRVRHLLMSTFLHMLCRGDRLCFCVIFVLLIPSLFVERNEAIFYSTY